MPHRVKKEVWLGPRGLEPPTIAKTRKNIAPYLKKNKNRGGGMICSSRAKHGIAPNY